MELYGFLAKNVHVVHSHLLTPGPEGLEYVSSPDQQRSRAVDGYATVVLHTHVHACKRTNIHMYMLAGSFGPD